MAVLSTNFNVICTVAGIGCRDGDYEHAIRSGCHCFSQCLGEYELVIERASWEVVMVDKLFGVGYPLINEYQTWRVFFE